MQIFKLKIDLDDDSGLTFNALVDRPAHNKSLMAFDKDAPKKMYFSDSKRMITGVAISANQLIYRFDEQLGEYYVYFEPKEVEKMILKMSRQQLLSSVNLMHDSKKVVSGITFIEGYFVSDTKRPPNDTQNVQNGSYVMTYYIEDEVLYNEIKNGRYVGFSVEGVFDQIPINIKTKTNNKKQNKMKKKNLFAMVFGKQKFAEATTVDGIVLSYEGELATGTAVFITDAEGNQVAAPEGSHTMEDGKTVVIDADGIITEVTDAEADDTMPEDVELSEVIEVLQELSKKYNTLEAKFEAFKKGTVKGKTKFSRKNDSPTWQEIVDAKKKK